MKTSSLTFTYATDLDEPRNSERFYAAAQKTFGFKQYAYRKPASQVATPASAPIKK
ncbi:MAG: hypothetical protein NVSMB14_13070 [Isosphaeraceae bacterium]